MKMPPRIKILVLDDDEDTLKVISDNLSNEGYTIDTFSSPVFALEQIQRKTYDTLLVDYQMPEMNGLEFLEKARSVNRDVPVIIFTAHGSIPQSVDAMKQGAYHYLAKPLNYDELKIVLKNSITLHLLKESHEKLQHELQKIYGTYHFIGKSKVMRKIFYQMEMASKSDAAVLIQGEAGTGKLTIAKIIHYNSRRKDALFVSVDCRAFPETFLSCELFGCDEHTLPVCRGKEYGQIHAAEGGTLFIDEIEYLPPRLQVKLLEFFREKESQNQEGKEAAQGNVRMMASATKSLKRAAEEKAFHEELFYCLNVFPIVVPPLRERREDILLLAQHFLSVYSQKYKKNILSFSPQAYARLISYDFPGNVRELEHIVERACVVCESSSIEVQDLTDFPEENGGISVDTLSSFSSEKKKILDNFERDYLVSLLTSTKGRIGEAAKVSGLAERNIYQKLKRYGLKKEDFKAGRSLKR